jgi:hypothetical protein
MSTLGIRTETIKTQSKHNQNLQTTKTSPKLKHTPQGTLFEYLEIKYHQVIKH